MTRNDKNQNVVLIRTVQAFGHEDSLSLYVCIPSKYAKRLHLVKGQPVRIRMHDDSTLLVTPLKEFGI